MQTADLRIQKLVKQVSQKCYKSYIHVQRNRIFSIDCSPCGKQIVCAADRLLILFDLSQQKQIAKTKRKHKGCIWSLRYSSDGKLIASSSFDLTIIIWNSSNLNQIGKCLQGHVDYIYPVAYSPDSLNLISGSRDESMIIWDVQSQQQVGESIKVGYWVLAVEYSHDGLQFISAGSGSGSNLDIWNSKTRERLIKLIGHKYSVNTVIYSLDDKYIISGSSDRTIKIRDAMTRQQIGNDLMDINKESHQYRSLLIKNQLYQEVMIKQFAYGILKQFVRIIATHTQGLGSCSSILKRWKLRNLVRSQSKYLHYKNQKGLILINNCDQLPY